MPGDKTEEKKKKRDNYSVSVKKTDSPLIREFADKQSNFSESVRYLILKFCKEYGVKNISNMLTEFMYFEAQINNIKIENTNIKNDSISNEKNQILESENELDKPNKNNIIIEEKVKEKETQNNNVDNNVDDEEDIPECYRQMK